MSDKGKRSKKGKSTKSKNYNKLEFDQIIEQANSVFPEINKVNRF